MGAAMCDIDAQRREFVVAGEPLGALQPRRPRCAGEPEGRAAALVARGPSVVWVYGYLMGRLTVSCLSPGSGGVLDVPQGASAACCFWYRGRASGCKGPGPSGVC